jgi:hypothetical protein
MGSYPLSSFTDSFAAFEALVSSLQTDEMVGSSHVDVETHIDDKGTEVLRLLLQDHLALRAERESKRPMTGADGEARTEARTGERDLMSLFGGVVVRRIALTKRGVSGGLRPMDAWLNLPSDSFSLVVRKEIAWAAANGSFESAVGDVVRLTGATVHKRQAERLAMAFAQDFGGFYESRGPEAVVSGDLLVLSFDGKGVVMRPEGLRAETQKRAKAAPKTRRLKPGQKPNRKRMAAVATIYDLEATPRGSEDVLRELGHSGPYKVPKKPKNKRVWASLERSMQEVVADGFLAALDRDENLKRRWVVLVDGNEDQLAAVRAQAAAIGIKVTIVLDVIHVLEYLWKAGQAVLGAQDGAAVEAWVTARAKRILEGESSAVAAGIRRSATTRNLCGDRRKAVDSCCGYLLNHRDELRYHEFLRDGLPIASGVIEGACRSLVRDRMDITGARWGLPGAEAVLKLRSLRASGDFDEYWRFHQRCELERNHLRSYAEDELAELREAA